MYQPTSSRHFIDEPSYHSRILEEELVFLVWFWSFLAVLPVPIILDIKIPTRDSEQPQRSMAGHRLLCFHLTTGVWPKDGSSPTCVFKCTHRTGWIYTSYFNVHHLCCRFVTSAWLPLLAQQTGLWPWGARTLETPLTCPCCVTGNFRWRDSPKLYSQSIL